MPKTKSQAEKRQEHEEKIKQQNEERRLQREAYAASLRERYENEKKEAVATQTLSKKELKKQRKAARKKDTDEDEEQNFNSEDNFANKKNSDSDSEERDETEEKTQAAIENERKSTRTKPPGRMVENHSTYCEGLRPILIRLEKSLTGCTIIPGALSQVSTHNPTFELRFQRMTDNNTYKFVARYGHTTQDVLISVPNTSIYTKDTITESIEDILKEKEIATSEDATETQDSSNICLSSLNRGVAAARNNLWREQHQAAHNKMKNQQQQAKHQQQIEKQKRKLANKDISKEELDRCAERDVDIITGRERTKNSMR